MDYDLDGAADRYAEKIERNETRVARATRKSKVYCGEVTRRRIAGGDEIGQMGVGDLIQRS